MKDTPVIDAQEAIEVTSHTVGCDGGGGALGHPKVYLTLGEDGKAVCGYCGRLFVLAKGAAPHAH
ncbi:MAG: zinc-finger domain-containing protein [Neomegalonema sp.]|nr:zinc-finger domain-containing protein [Neomegalonema sp.]